jgi:tetratricopeptide (TPR) repeat protein
LDKTATDFLKEAIDQYETARYEEALVACNNAIELDPLSTRAYHGSGLALVQLGRYAEAYKSYQKAKELNLKNPKFFVHVGELYFILGFYEDAGLWYRKAIQLNGQYKAAYNHKTEELLEKAVAFYVRYKEDQDFPTFENYEATLRQVLLFDPTNKIAKESLVNAQPRRASPSRPSYDDTTYISRTERETTARINNQWGYVPFVHPANCRCHECWEP